MGQPRAPSSLADFAALAPVGILQTSLDGRVLYANRHILEALGYRGQEEAQDVGMHGLHADPARREVFLAELRAKGRLVGAEVELLTRAGEAHRFLVSAVLGDDAITCWAMDITPQTQLAEELRQSTSRLRCSEDSFHSLLEHGPDAVVVHRLGRTVYVNQRTADLLGYERQELLGRSVLDFVHPDDRAMVQERMARAALSGEPLAPVDQRYVRKDGSVVWMEVAALATVFDGAPAALAVARDVTERRQLQAKAIQADRLTSIGSLAAGVAHEINNPLSYVIANLAFLTEGLHELEPSGGTAVAQMRDALHDASTGADRVQRIVRDLRTFARVDAEATGPVDVRTAVEAAIQLTNNEIRHRARLVRSLQAVPPVDACESRLCQVFVNLLVNAAQAIPEGRAGDHEIRVCSRIDGNSVVVEVHDTGCGIAQADVSRVFEPFFTTKPHGFGTGLGLSICHGIVSDLGGEIAVETAAGRGSVFRVRLPAATRRAVGVKPSAPPVIASGRRLSLLIVDDEPLLGRSLVRVVGPGHDVEVVTSACEALTRVRAGADYDIVLCDLMMPEVPGWELHAQLERERPALAQRIVFMTGGAFTPQGRAFLDRVPNARLSKPIAASDLRALLEGVDC